MKFIADENVDNPIVVGLRTAGFEIIQVNETSPGSSDREVLDRAEKESAVLITADKDFGELVFRQRQSANGVILIRLAGLSPSRKAEVIQESIQSHLEELEGNFTVITSGTVRIRKIKPL